MVLAFAVTATSFGKYEISRLMPLSSILVVQLQFLNRYILLPAGEAQPIVRHTDSPASDSRS
ncbi:MAG: hypothetical protein STSR0007_07280 [Thermovirga sp.]